MPDLNAFINEYASLGILSALVIYLVVLVFRKFKWNKDDKDAEP